MIGRLTALILLGTVFGEGPQQISLTVADAGDNITLQCPVTDKESKFFYWNKMRLGHMPQTVATVTLGKVTDSEQFRDSHFTIRQEGAQFFLTIRNVTKEDEATYFCQNMATFSQAFLNGTFLAVNDHNQQKHVYVKQSPETESVQLGNTVTLNCSLLSKNKENRVQCPDEHSVYWFRAGSEGFNQGVIYTNRNKSHTQEQRSCSYSLSKTIQDSSDSGTYYCAVVTCGEILFGEGTKVETRNCSESDPVVLVLGVLLSCCGIVIAVLLFYIHQKKVCECCKGSRSVSHHECHEKTAVDLSNDLEGEAPAVNYAPLDFSLSRVIKGKKNKEFPQESVYTAVRADDQNQ
uniref:Ig-like domain-containing protein n=1 Tax=Anabas testudineus TaxID=64144 RepID=A0A3Q1H858_ANATE